MYLAFAARPGCCGFDYACAIKPELLLDRPAKHRLDIVSVLAVAPQPVNTGRKFCSKVFHL
jgi:hypothetical protein